MQEKWKDIDGFEKRYQVSSLGRVRSLLRTIERKQRKNEYGYSCVGLLSGEGKFKILKVHRLVARAFLPLKSGREEVNHIDGNKNNNRVGNLEWCTRRHNMEHNAKQRGMSLKKMMTGLGSVKTKKKAASSKNNGKTGGRPLIIERHLSSSASKLLGKKK